MQKRRELLFNTIGGNDELENGYLAENLRKIISNGVRFLDEDNLKIFNYIKKFYEDYGTVPSYPSIKSYFDSLLDPLSLQALDMIYPINNGTVKYPLFGANFDALIDDVLEDQHKKDLRKILVDINKIAEQGEEFKVRGSKVWKQGTLAAINEALPLLFDLENKLAPPPIDQYDSSDVSRFWSEMIENSKREDLKISTGFPTLDIATFGGLEEKCFWLIAAPPGQLKSTLCLTMAYNQFMCGKIVEFLSIEMTSKDMNFKMQALHSGNESYWGEGCIALETNKIANPRFMSAQEKKRYKEVLEDIGKQSGIINFHHPHDHPTVAEVKAHLITRECKLKKDIDVVYYDHGELIKCTGNSNDGFSTRLADSLQKLRALSLNYRNGKGIRFVLAYQISRAGLESAVKGEHGFEGLYSMTNLSWTTEAERSATFILCSYYYKTFQANRKSLMTWVKNRNGPMNGRFEVDVEMKYSFIQESEFENESLNAELIQNYIDSGEERPKSFTGRKTKTINSVPDAKDLV